MGRDENSPNSLRRRRRRNSGTTINMHRPTTPITQCLPRRRRRARIGKTRRAVALVAKFHARRHARGPSRLGRARPRRARAAGVDARLRLGPEPEEEWPREQRADSASRSSRFDLQRRSMASGSPVDGRRSSPRTTYSGAPSRAGPRRSGMSSVRTGRGAAAAAASAGGASITTTRCVDGRGSVRKFCTGNKYLI